MDYPDFIFSSESYGYKLAEELTKKAKEELKRDHPCTHIPFNPARDQTVIRATDVRADPVAHWQQLIPSMRARYTQSICLFGQESVGKTTLTRKAAELFKSVYLNEWARPYLEGLPSPEVTTERMFNILYGQAALEKSAQEQYYTPFRFYDTDLLSTLGYWELWSSVDKTRVMENLIDENFRGQLRQLWKPKDLYIIPKDNIPFTPDPLRYGGDRRETDTLYWINLCERYRLRYYILQESSISGRMEEIEDQCRKQLKRALGFEGYVRDK
jgi:nicotinamide riboside kinase